MSYSGFIAQKSREIRVFLSSTFRDMDEERTFLVKQVFPKIRAACLERQVGFSEIDLRWGVSEEEAKNGATVEICLKEINRCRDFPPFFIGFLGERYGWVPKHDELAAYWERHSESEFGPAIREAIERGISVTELEMELAVLEEGAAEKIADHALFCLRDSGLTNTLYAKTKAANSKTREADFYDAGQGKLDTLKSKIRQSGFLGLDNYTSVEQFGAAIETYLLAQLDHYFPADKVPTALQRSNAAHAGFRFHRLQNFLPRTDVRDQMIQAIKQRIAAPSLGPILVTGPSGQGKSALMADLARHYQTQLTKEWCVIDHYIGADNANHLEGWVDRILQSLHPDIHDIAGDIPASPKDKVEALSTWISMAARRNNCRYLFILDALDQLSDGGKNLDILSPQTLGPDGILIASAADDNPARTATANWQTFIKVPPLTNKLRTQLVTDTLARYRKHLPKDLAKKLASDPQSGSPLFLGLALEELRVDARHETLAHITADILKQPDAEQLFLNRFLLDADNGRPELPELAACFMALLGASKAGLSENELADLLAQADDPIAEDTGKPRLPQIHLSRLLTNLAPFLLNKQGRRAPMHRILGKVALGYYGTVSVRKHLYTYFASGYGKDGGTFEARDAAEALFQITELVNTEHKGQGATRKQLIHDLGVLHIPVNLHNTDEEAVKDALNTIVDSDKDKHTLSTLWQKQLDIYDADALRDVSDPINDFAGWMRDLAFDRYRLPRRLFDSLLMRQELLFNKDAMEIGRTLNLLGLICGDMADYKPIRRLYERALAIREKSLGPDHPEVATSINNLAAYLFDTGKPEDSAIARPLFERALAIREKSLVPDHPDVASSLNNLAHYLSSTGAPEDLAAALPLFERALAIREKSLGPDHPEVATSLNNMAGYLKRTGNPINIAAARSLYERALTICEKFLGHDHPDVAICLNNLAAYLEDTHTLEDKAAARALYERSISIYEKSLGPDHPDVALSLNNFAHYLSNTGAPEDIAAVLPLFERALAIREKSLGVEHPDVATSLNNLAFYFNNSANSEVRGRARPLFERAIAIYEKSLGKEHPDVALSLNNLGLYLHNTGNPDDSSIARPMFERALAIREKSLGPNHPDVAISLNNLLLHLQSKGNQQDLLDAIPVSHKLYSLVELRDGVDSDETLHQLQVLANILRIAGKLDEAEPLQREAAKRFARLHGDDSIQAATGYIALGALLELKSNFDEAKQNFCKALEIREQELGKDAVQTKLVRRRLEEFNEK